MSYSTISVKEVLKKINCNDYYLPAIQRKFVWKTEQIESLFDSIMRHYPIGTFLFWMVEKDNRDKYIFYEFIKHYHEKNRYLNQTANEPKLKDTITGILDGQQRLSSMYIALQGTYAYKKKGARRDNPNAYPSRKLYLNILKDLVKREDEDFIYEFNFLTEEEAKDITSNWCGFLVSEVLKWGEDPEIDEYYDDLINRDDIDELTKDNIKAKKNNIKRMLRILHQQLVSNKIINYFSIKKQDLDEILDIFVRVNNAGTQLKKSDLLFSTIVSHWESGRQEMENFLKEINEKGDYFSFDNDFIMRACLVLTDSPVLFKVGSFQKKNIKKIKEQWKNIQDAISKTVDLLVEFGFSKETLTSQNAVIPIAYYFIKDGSNDINSKKEIRQYLIRSLLKQIYGGQGDHVLSNIRDSLRGKIKDEKSDSTVYVLKQKNFSFGKIAEIYLSGDKSLNISEENIEEILEYKKGPYTFMILSLLYPNLKFSQVKFHQDHLHPASLFTDAKLREFQINKEKWDKWKEMKDKLPNLQLMEAIENQSKNKAPLKKWVEREIRDIDKFKRDNFIADEVDLGFENFENFYKIREESIKNKIKEALRMNKD